MAVNLKNTTLILVASLWFVVQLLFYKQLGVVTTCDTPAYLDFASTLINEHTLPLEHYSWYLGYNIFIAAIFKAGGSLFTVVWMQVLISGCATIAVYKTSKNISGHWITGAISAFLYVLWFKVHQWNFYIMTESLFTSMVAISFYLLSRRLTLTQCFYLIPVFIFTILTRPTGFAMLAALLAYGLSSLLQQHKKTSALFVIATLAFAVPTALFILNKMLTTFTLVETYRDGTLIYASEIMQMDGSKSNMPAENAQPLFKLLYFIYHNPVYFCQLALAKFGLWFFHIKPYFSWTHNLFIAIVLYPSYIFALSTLPQKKYLNPIGKAALMYLLVQAFTIMLTVENWDGRFLLPITPVIMVYAGIGLYRWQIPRKIIFRRINHQLINN